MIGAAYCLPLRLLVCVGNDHTLLGQTDPPEQGIAIAVERDRASGFDVLEAFVTPQGADDKLRITFPQHYVCAVVGNEFGQVVQQRFENPNEAKVFGERDVGVTKYFRFTKYGLLPGEQSVQLRHHPGTSTREFIK